MAFDFKLWGEILDGTTCAWIAFEFDIFNAHSGLIPTERFSTFLQYQNNVKDWTTIEFNTQAFLARGIFLFIGIFNSSLPFSNLKKNQSHRYLKKYQNLIDQWTIVDKT